NSSGALRWVSFGGRNGLGFRARSAIGATRKVARFYQHSTRSEFLTASNSLRLRARKDTMSSGIYIITNTINGKRYIGLSTRIKRRIMEHRTPRNLQRSTVLARAFRKYGIENFKFEVLEECEPSLLAERERFWIAQLKPEYNMTTGGDGSPGHITTDEVKARLSAAAKAQWATMSEDQKQQRVDNNLKRPPRGHPVSEITRQKIREKLTGSKASFQAIAKRSASQKIAMRGNQNGNKPVVGIDPDSYWSQWYPSIIQAAQEVGIHSAGITSVLKGRQKTAGGLLWQYRN
ncbi:MAG TPA: GIY-YIG nuclease family protein, partial [Candidatus Sulfotelmatobacter sp.]|nr:GIY-YIG nuclease family protein [Candidatus Sulfotelmatobacter sp.]